MEKGSLSMFQRLSIFLRIWQQQLVRYAQLLQQLATPWTLRREVDEFFH